MHFIFMGLFMLNDKTGLGKATAPPTNRTMSYGIPITLFFIMVCSIVLSIYITMKKNHIQTYTFTYRYTQVVLGETVATTKEVCVRFSGNNYTLKGAAKEFLRLQPVHDGVLSTREGCNIRFPNPHTVGIVNTPSAFDSGLISPDASGKKQNIQFIK